VSVLVLKFIGKEADQTAESGLPPVAKDRAKLRRFIAEVQSEHRISDRDLCKKAHVSHHTLHAVRKGKDLSNAPLHGLVGAAQALRQKAMRNVAKSQGRLERPKVLRENVGGGASSRSYQGLRRPMSDGC
jgi:hypothetical protein